jgi:hypothetical protein
VGAAGHAMRRLRIGYMSYDYNDHPTGSKVNWYRGYSTHSY